MEGIFRGVRKSVRIYRLILHVVYGLTLSGVVFPMVSAGSRAGIFHWWSKRLLRILAVKVRPQGEPSNQQRPILLLSNHVSWLDVFVINSVMHTRFIAKSEIRNWPLVGWMVSKQGTLFIERGRRKDTARVNSGVEVALEKGDRVVLFAEGTTGDGTFVRPFHASLLQSLVNVGGYAMPVAIKYLYPDGTLNDRAAYTGDRSLWDSVNLLAEQDEIYVDAHFLPTHPVDGKHRREIADAAGEAVATTLGVAVPSRRRETASDLPSEAPIASGPTDSRYPATQSRARV